MPNFPSLSESAEVDVAVIGAGMTGIVAAYLLKKSGHRVALIERDQCANQDTANTTAHLTCVTDLRLRDLVKKIGEDHAGAVWDAGMAAIDQIEEIARAEGIACDFARAPGYLHAALSGGASEEEALQEDAAIAQELGFDAEFVRSAPLVHRAAVRFSNQAQFHPLKFLSQLVQRIPGNGCIVCEKSEAKQFAREGDGITVGVNDHTLRCKYLVIATDVPLVGIDGAVGATFLQTKIAPYSSYAIGAKVVKGIVPQASFWDTSDPYYYLRATQLPGSDYVIFGGLDHKTGQEVHLNERFDKLEALLQQIIPEAMVDRRWSGQVIESHDGLPLIGETSKGQFVATGYSGNGLTFGTVAGNMVCDLLAGRRNPWAELFNPNRSGLLSGAWDYVRQNLDYPYYLLRDRFSKTDSEPLETVKSGQGQIRLVNGNRTAVYRDVGGKLTLLSPVCTHLGCIVRWNEVDSTWDCPCHGSRFRCTGEVLAGPAEKPLAPMNDAAAK